MLTSIVILTHNELEYTQRCIDSIRARTPEAYEFIFVDNASTDGTLEYLRSIDGATVISNDHNMGFGGACNQGIAASTGERILLLNNDTVVTDGWLAALHAGLDADPVRGIVGPRSNHVADRQLVSQVSYDTWTLEGLEEFAAQYTAEHRELRFQVGRLIGFCMLIRREVIDAIGGFDVRFGLGNFEDDDLCVRAMVAGFENWVCGDSYVHHFGSRTFQGAGIEHSSSMSANLERFCRKWKMEVATQGGVPSGYVFGTALDNLEFDPALHYSPLVATADDDAIATFEHRGTSVLVPAVRDDSDASRELFDAALQHWGAADDVTLVVRVDPRDGQALDVLGDAADAVGDDLPDIVVVEHRDDNDAPLVRAVDRVLLPSRSAVAIDSLARAFDTPTQLCSTLDAAA